MTSPYSSTSTDTTAGSPGRTVVGLFTDRSEAEEAIRDLKEAGFTDQQVGVAMRDRDDQKQLMEDTGTSAAEGAATGAVSGGVVGGLIGLLGSLLIPGVGPIVVGGVLASALTGAGIGAATGGIIGGLMGLGVPEEDAQHFNRGIESGSTLVTVNAGGRTPEALAILQKHNVDLGPSGAARFQDLNTSSSDLGASIRDATTTGASSAGVGAFDEKRLDTGLREDGLFESVTEPSVRPVGDRSAKSFAGQERRRSKGISYAGPERRREAFV